MKKLILMLLVVAAMSFAVTSCKKDKKEEVKTEVEVKEEAKEILASNDVLYQCPMDCEEGKSYTEAGTCPVCKMDLKEKKVEMEDAHEHEKDSVN